MASSFKDALLAPTPIRYEAPSFFPTFEWRLNHVLRDSTKRYSNFGHFLYQRQLIEITDSTVGNLRITPLINLSYGVELQDTNRKRYQNTRGVRMGRESRKESFIYNEFL